MKPIDYLLLGLAAVVVGLVVAHLIKRKKQGKGGCGCNCRNCPSAGACQSKTEEKDV